MYRIILRGAQIPGARSATEFCMVASDIYRASVWNLLNLLAPEFYI